MAVAHPLCDRAPEFSRYWHSSRLSHALRHEGLCEINHMDFSRAEQCLLLLGTSYRCLQAIPHCILCHAAMQLYLFSLSSCLGLKSQLKISIFCPCILIAFFLFPSPFAAAFKLSCVRVQFSRVDVTEHKVALC